MRQLRPWEEEQATYLRRQAECRDGAAAGQAYARAETHALAVWSQSAFAAVEPFVAQSATCLQRVTERASRDASHRMAVGR